MNHSTDNVYQYEFKPSANAIVDIRDLSRRFGDKCALQDIDISIPQGGVFGLVGVNGAGKTTLIKHVLGLLKAASGSVSVFGFDPVQKPEQVLSHVGYMSEVTELPEWMSVYELIRYTKAFYPSWDKQYADKLLNAFELELNKKVRDLSKGQRARTALLLALAHKPELLILDEPSSGLDPLMRRDILRTVIQTVADEGHTVLFSSHLLEEVERIADSVAIIDGGKIVAQNNLEALKQEFHQIVVNFPNDVQQPQSIVAAIEWSGSARHWSALHRGDLNVITQRLSDCGAEIVSHSTPNLDQLFVALVGNKHSTGALHA